MSTFDILSSGKIVSCLRVFGFQYLFVCPCEYDLTSVYTSAWTNIYNIVTFAHDILVMFDNYDTISYACEPFEIFYEHFIVSWMESDRWFIENVDNPLKSGTNLGSKADTLTLSTRESVRTTSKSDVVQSHSGKEFETFDDIFHDRHCDLLFFFRKNESLHKNK